MLVAGTNEYSGLRKLNATLDPRRVDWLQSLLISVDELGKIIFKNYGV